MRLLLRAALGLAAVALILLSIGFLLPREHIASVEARYRAAPGVVYDVIVDVPAAPAWRTGLERVELLSAAAEPLRWREVSDWGTLTYVQESAEPGRRVVSRIVDEGQGFGGTWTFELDSSAAGTTLRITEHGDVSNPIYRLMSRAMGYHEGMEQYARDLAARLGEEAEVEVVRR